MTTSNEQAAKLPLIKRIVIALRGGVGGGISAVVVVLMIVLMIALGTVGFLGGLAVATKRNQAIALNQAKAMQEARAAHAKLAAENAELQKQLADQKTQGAGAQDTITQLKAELEKDKIERDAMNKVLDEIKESLQAAGSKGEKNDKVQKAVNGAMLKFGKSECDLQQGSAVSSKQDLKCLNLREAIDAMNGKGGKDAPKTPPPPKSPG